MTNHPNRSTERLRRRRDLYDRFLNAFEFSIKQQRPEGMAGVDMIVLKAFASAIVATLEQERFRI